MKRRRPERGATVVEAAVIGPLFIFLLVAILESALYLLDLNGLRNGTRMGVRESAASASDSLSDYNTLKTMQTALSNLANRVDGIVIYKAQTAKSPVPPACLNALNTGTPVPGATECNVYTAAQFKTLDPLHFGFTLVSNADPLLWDKQWPSTGRNDSLTGTTRPDLVGIYVQIHHQGLTGVLPTRVVSSTAVRELEPQRAA